MYWNNSKEAQKIERNILDTWATLRPLGTRLISQCPQGSPGVSLLLVFGWTPFVLVIGKKVLADPEPPISVTQKARCVLLELQTEKSSGRMLTA